jgi:hypothetical protein
MFMRCHLVDSLGWLYPDSVMPPKPVTSFEVDVARGQTAAVQILVAEADGPVRVKVSAGKARVYQLISVPVEVNTGPVGFVEKPGEPQNPYVTRRAPFRVFDAMQPVKGYALAKGEPLGLYVQVPIDLKTRPGRCEFQIQVSCGSQKVPLTLAARVHKVRIPPIGPESLKYTNWFSLSLMAERHKLRLWSTAHWDMIRQYAHLMVRARQNMFWLQGTDIFEVADGRPQLNVARLQKIVDTFTREGMYYIEGPHFATRPEGQWLAKRFVLAIQPKIEATGDDGTLWVARIATQLQEQIERNGWHDRWVQHVADEPIDQNAEDYRILAGTVRRYMPAVRIVEATLCKAVAGAIDIWVPQNWHFERDREFLARQRTLGDEVWHYTCCHPGGRYLNRLMDGELIRPTLLHWGNALYDLPGFLHWGLNHYRPSQDPFRQSVVDHGGGNSLPAGDTHVVYPGTDGPWPSVRLEAEREGVEDYELLQQLKARNRRQCEKIIHQVMHSFCDYTTGLDNFRQARRQLLAALA